MTEREALEDMCLQFAYKGSKNGRLVLSTGGLSALEAAFEALGWDDPHPYPEGECQTEGCHGEAVGGAPTRRGYKFLCAKCFEKLDSCMRMTGEGQ